MSLYRNWLGVSGITTLAVLAVGLMAVSYTHLRAHETLRYRVWRLRL